MTVIEKVRGRKLKTHFWLADEADNVISRFENSDDITDELAKKARKVGGGAYIENPDGSRGYFDVAFEYKWNEEDETWDLVEGRDEINNVEGEGMDLDYSYEDVRLVVASYDTAVSNYFLYLGEANKEHMFEFYQSLFKKYGLFAEDVNDLWIELYCRP